MGSEQSKEPRKEPLLPEPWRLTPSISAWNVATERRLREECMLRGDSMDFLGKKDQIKILMFGPTQNGKSSVVNSQLCALIDEIDQHVLAASSPHSVTCALHSPNVRVEGQRLRFKLTDMPGIFEKSGPVAGYAHEYITAVIGGHIKEDTEVCSGPLDTSASYYKADPGYLDKPCCVVLVMRAGNPLSANVKKKFGIVLRESARLKLKVAVILTFTDNITRDVEKKEIAGRDVQYIFRSEAVREAVRAASRESAIPEGFIHPVTNYTREVETLTEMNVLHLFTLSRILILAKRGAMNRHDLQNASDSD